MSKTNVVKMLRCRRCGKPARERELLYQGELVGGFEACDGCIAAGDALLDRVRPIFEAMLAAGVEREMASDAMTYLLRRIDPPPENGDGPAGVVTAR